MYAYVEHHYVRIYSAPLLSSSVNCLISIVAVPTQLHCLNQAYELGMVTESPLAMSGRQAKADPLAIWVVLDLSLIHI